MPSKDGVIVYKAKLKTMTLEQIREKAKQGDFNAKAELFRRTQVPSLITREMRQRKQK